MMMIIFMGIFPVMGQGEVPFAHEKMSTYTNNKMNVKTKNVLFRPIFYMEWGGPGAGGIIMK